MNRITNLLSRLLNLSLFFLKTRKIYKTSKKNKSGLPVGQTFRILFALSVKSIIYPTWNKEVTQDIFGMKIHGFNYGTILYLFNEIFINDEYAFDKNAESLNIIDCGANIGMSILYFKYKSPNCSIKGFEPNPHVFKLLEKTIISNGFKNVSIHNVALSDKDEELEFYLPENIGSLGGSLLQERGGDNLHIVQARKLSDFINNQSVSLLKMDIEGAEWAVFRDLINNDQLKNISELQVEYHHKIENNKSVISQFLAPLEEQGFEYNIRCDFEKKGGFQDLFIVFYKN